MSRLILLNKPFQVLTQFTDTQGRRTLADFIAEPGLYPAGRLDYDSEGLVLLTDDGTLQQQISHPRYKLTKTYWVQVEGDPTDDQLEPLRRGITLNDGPCRPAMVKRIIPPPLWPRDPPVRNRLSIPDQWLEIRINEGRNRQVRRMTAAAGFPTLRLVRAQVGEWSLGALQPGEWRGLTVHAAKPVSKRRPRRL